MLFKNSRHCACCRLAQQCHQYRHFQTPLQSGEHHQYTRLRCCARPVPVDRTEVFFGLALVLGTVILFVESLPYQQWDPSTNAASTNKISGNTEKQATVQQQHQSTEAFKVANSMLQTDNKQISILEGAGMVEPTSDDKQTNEIARNVLEQILRQYYSRVLGSMIMVHRPALVESQVVSKRRQEELPSTTEQIITSSSSQPSYGKVDTGSSLEDHYMLIESYARNPLDFFTTTNNTINSDNLVGDASVASDNKRRAIVNENTIDSSASIQDIISNGENDNYFEALLNEIAIDHMLNQQEASRAGNGDQHQQMNEYADGDSTINNGNDHQQAENNNEYLGDTDMNIRASLSSTINDLNQQKNDGGLSNLLLRRQQQHQSTVAPAFISSLASSFAMDDNFSKRHIRFHPCYFNPISCFTKR